jgi:hypothetical protein
VPPAASAARVGAPVEPIKDPSRVKGQMGTSNSKEARAAERQRIMQSLNEDRSSYMERQGRSGAPATTAPASVAPAGSLSTAASEAAAVSSGGATAQAEDRTGSIERYCPKRHLMTSKEILEDAWCDMCQTELLVGATCSECNACDYIQCHSCGS